MMKGKLCLLVLMDVQCLLKKRPAFLYPLGVCVCVCVWGGGGRIPRFGKAALLCPNHIVTAATGVTVLHSLC